MAATTENDAKPAAKPFGALWEIEADLAPLRRIELDTIEKVHVTPDDAFVKSIAASGGPMQPIVVVTAGAGKVRIVEGKRRVAACRLLGYERIDARVYNADSLSAKDRAIITIRMNHHRSFNPVAEYAAVNTLRKSGMKDTADIAKAVGLNIRQIQRLTRLDKLAEPLRDALEAGRMTFDTALKAAALPAKDQKKLIKLAEDGGEDEAGRISADAVHALIEKGPAHGLDKLFSTDVQANPTTLIASALALLERADALIERNAVPGSDSMLMAKALDTLRAIAKKGGK